MMVKESSTWTRAAVFDCLKTNLLTLLTVLGVFVGIISGAIMKTMKPNWTKREAMYVGFLGEIFISMLKGLTLPLIVTFLIAALGSLDFGLSKKIGVRGLAYYMFTSAEAVILGIILVVIIQPGIRGGRIEKPAGYAPTPPTTIEDTLLDLVRSFFPPNILQAAFQRARTTILNKTGEEKFDLRRKSFKTEFVDAQNIIGWITFAIAVGIALTILAERGKPMVRVFQSFADVMVILVTWITWLGPVGVASLIAGKIVEEKNIIKTMEGLAWYLLTVWLGLMIQMFVILPLFYFIFTRKSPLTYFINLAPCMAMAFGTSSSSATVPVTMKCVEENNHVDCRVSRYLIPIGANINMDGTALYEAVAAIFIAQMQGIEMTIGKYLAISVTANFAALGAAGIPSAGLVTLVLVLDSVGLPADHVSYIISIDWFLDRFRTMVNVLGDAYAAGIIAHICRKDLANMDSEEKAKAESQPEGEEEEEQEMNEGNDAENKLDSLESSRQLVQ